MFDAEENYLGIHSKRLASSEGATSLLNDSSNTKLTKRLTTQIDAVEGVQS
jgi:hypothetical protein